MAIFKRASDFQSNMIYYLSGLTLKEEQKLSLRKSFVKLDSDGDGYISMQEAT